MATYGVVNTSNCKFTKDGGIVSAKFYSGASTATVENGTLVKLDGLVSTTANTQVFKAVVPDAITNLAVGVVCTPEIIYDETTKSVGALDQYINAAGQIITVGMLAAGDFLELSDAVITVINDDDDVPAVGSFVTITKDSGKWTEKSSLGGTETLYGKIINRYVYKSGKYMNTVQILKAN